MWIPECRRRAARGMIPLMAIPRCSVSWVPASAGVTRFVSQAMPYVVGKHVRANQKRISMPPCPLEAAGASLDGKPTEPFRPVDFVFYCSQKGR